MNIKWSDKEIVNWAIRYTTGGFTPLVGLEKEMGIPHSTLHWCFTHRLPFIDQNLYRATLNRLRVGVHMRTRRITRMKKFTLVGVDGNAFSIMGYTAKALRSVGLDEKVELMYEEARSGDYSHLIATCDEYLQMANAKLGPTEDDDEEDDDDEY